MGGAARTAPPILPIFWFGRQASRSSKNTIPALKEEGIISRPGMADLISYSNKLVFPDLVAAKDDIAKARGTRRT